VAAAAEDVALEDKALEEDEALDDAAAMAEEGTDEDPVVDPTVVVAADVAEAAALDCETAAAPPMQALLEEDWMEIGDE
jgi:hypothetical protein